MKGELESTEVQREKVKSRREGERQRKRERESWLFNLYGEWERVAVIHGFVSQLIKERKFLKNIHHQEI